MPSFSPEDRLANVKKRLAEQLRVMKIKKLVRTFFILSAILVMLATIAGCLSNQSLGSRGPNEIITATPTANHLKDTPDEDAVYWFSGKKIEGVITLNANINTVVYMRGDLVHEFLKNNYYTSSTIDADSSVNQFCLVADLSSAISGAKQQLRIRAMPYSLNNLSSGGTERLFRLDIPSTAENQSACLGTISALGTCLPAATHDGLRNKADCEKSSGTWEIGKCLIANYSTEAACLAAVGGFSWANNKCYNASYKTEVDCTNYKNRTPSLNISWQNSYHYTTSALSAFTPTALCSSCTSILTLQNISLYRSESGQINDASTVDVAELNLGGVGLRIDTKNQTTEETTGCTNSSCIAQQYDCCLNGQCVDDNTVKSNAQASYPEEYAQAMADIEHNPMNYLFWPNIFNICSNIQVPTPTPTPGPNPAEEAQARLNQEIMDYNCLEGAAADTADYRACCLSGTTYCSEETYECLREALQSTPDYSACCVGSSCGAAYYNTVLGNTSTQESRYNAVLESVWARCGCAANNQTPAPNDGDTVCAGFGLQPQYTSGTQTIEAILCKEPQPTTEPTPFVNTSIQVSSKAVPHRYFTSSSGSAIDDLAAVVGAIPEQEGTPFAYMDNSAKTDPDNGQFNINSILGQISLSLNQAAPAKVINVDFDQVYIITVSSGFYTPCPICDKDGWAYNYLSHPPSQKGIGLEATSYITDRQGDYSNSSLGNYEDTIFGRACWIPPTMIPFSHFKSSNLNTQRRNRLATQSAYFVNGYQRDWYGFNKGALIGSFDGVSWFAVANGRRVRATSSKLFLAINAPFGDLADPGNTTVGVVLDLGNEQGVSDYDYDPYLEPTDPNQNRGASCQRYHICSSDRDCISRLGWEYVCEDVTKIKSRWPKFDTNANEIVDEQINEASFTAIEQILRNFAYGENNKRCVYRGGGAFCKVNYNTNLLNTSQKKLLTCAPNFYCSSASSSDFNYDVAREPAISGTYKIGRDANVLGRPKNYIAAASALPANIQTNLRDNATIYSTSTADFGMCRPGKSLASGSHLTQHSSKDASWRTDYISQIGSCNSGATGDARVWACPVIDDSGNYLITFANYNQHHQQNMCGGESKSSTGISPFSSIEAATLGAVAYLEEATMAKDGCLRRAGAICQTDLDCGPNKLHADYADQYSRAYFGNSDAEKLFWSESLICGQAQKAPLITIADASTYYNYDVGQNRCCREVGKDITLFTSGTTTLIPDLGSTNTSLKTWLLPKDGPTASGRYSRYQIVAPLGIPAAVGTPYAEIPQVKTNTTPLPYQWKTIGDTAKKSCCGGGWVRKFVDGSHDWTNNRRLQIDKNNFQCLNYDSEMIFIPNDYVSSVSIYNTNEKNYDKDKDKLCVHPGNKGCIQIEFNPASNYEITYPTLMAQLEGSLVTGPSAGNGSPPTVNHWAYYQPIPYPDSNLIPTGITEEQNFFASYDYDQVSFYVPIYMHATRANRDNITSVNITYYDSAGAACSTAPAAQIVCGAITPPFPALAANQWCVSQDAGGYDIFNIRALQNAPCSGNPWSYANITIDFNIPQSFASAFEYVPNTTVIPYALNPGNTMYYLTKLGRLELLGIPQIFYEPLYCVSNKDRLVPGIFKTTLENRSDFEGSADTFQFSASAAARAQSLAQIYDSAKSTDDSDIFPNTAVGTNERITFQNQVIIPPVFSSNEFICCLQLNEETTTAANCCSNYSFKDDDSGKTLCKLPPNADLHLYFNRFVSSEGSGTALDNPLKDEDFIPLTGEPKTSSTVDDKIYTLGLEYCGSGEVIVGGSAFGYYTGEGIISVEQSTYDGGEEDGQFFLSLVDSSQDIDGTNDDKSASMFDQGLRWNHHFYCK